MERFFIMIDGQQQGPLTKQDMINQGISNDTYVYNKALGTWKMISEIPGFFNSITEEQQPPVFNQEPVFTPSPTSSISNNRGSYSQQSRPVIPTTPPKTYLTESILVTIFCCLPFGIAGIVNASKVESRFASGDIQGAEEASVNAKKWYQWALWTGLIIGIISVITNIAALS